MFWMLAMSVSSSASPLPGRFLPHVLDTPKADSPWASTLPGPRAPVRFIAVGDAGEGNDAQYAVSDAIEQVCAERGCDFVVYLGDNFYTDGVESVDDDEFQVKFEDPYANLDLPFYVVNGNHDLDAGSGGFEAWKADIYVEYTDQSDKWTMPAPYYTMRHGDVELFALDTTQLLYGDDEQEDWLLAALDGSTAPWKVVFGHHPYRTNGAHGHDDDDQLEEVFDDIVCDRASVYLSGHDHNLQWLEPECGMELIVSGAGAKLTPLEYQDFPSFYEDDQHEGFMWLEVGDDLTGAFYDSNANELFSMTVEP